MVSLEMHLKMVCSVESVQSLLKFEIQHTLCIQKEM